MILKPGVGEGSGVVGTGFVCIKVEADRPFDVEDGIWGGVGDADITSGIYHHPLCQCIRITRGQTRIRIEHKAPCIVPHHRSCS